VEYEGKEIPVKNLVDCYKNRLAKNAADEEEKKKKEDEEKLKKENAGADEAKKKEDEEKAKKEADEKAKAEKENSVKCSECEKDVKKEEAVENVCNECSEKRTYGNDAGIIHFNRVKNAAAGRGAPQEIKITNMRDRLAEGRQKYGTAK
jgi:membrane protein involved in colicin uptake